MGIVSQALGRQDDQAEEQQEPEDNPQEEAAEQKPAGGEWNGDKVLQTATQLAFETLYSQGGIQAVEGRLQQAKDLPGEVADIAANVMASAMQKAVGAGRTIPQDTLQKLAMTLIFEVLQIAGIMRMVQDNQAKPLARQILPAVLQLFQQKMQQPQQPQAAQPDEEAGDPNDGMNEENAEGMSNGRIG